MQFSHSPFLKKGKMYENDFRGETLKDSWDQKKNEKEKQKQKNSAKMGNNKKKIWVATSALLLFWQLCPQELPQWQNTE